MVADVQTLFDAALTRAWSNARLPQAFSPDVAGPASSRIPAMELPSDPGLMLFAYTAEPGTPSEDGLKLLASWAATQELALPAAAGGEAAWGNAPMGNARGRHRPSHRIIPKDTEPLGPITVPKTAWVR